MRIAYIGSFQRLYDEEGIAQALESLGHIVDRYEEVSFTRSDIAYIVDDDFRANLVLFAKLKIPTVLGNALVDSCKKEGIKTVCYMPDLFFGLSRQECIRQKYPIFRADLVCSPDGGHDEQWEEYGINHKLLRQGIPKSEIHDGSHSDLPYDVAFVGSHNPEFKYRTELMRRLSEQYKSRFHWVGRNYSKECRGSDLNDLYASVKIVVGDSVYSPHYWSNRIYETLGRGGFLIHPHIPGLDQEFEYYKHFIPYDYGDFDGLFVKIEHYLKHPEEREEIRKAGQKHVKENYTLTHRAKQLITYANVLC